MITRPLGLIVIAVGVAIIIVGLLMWAGALSWFGRLPGDIRIENGNTRFSLPITSMLLVSFALTLFVSLIRRIV